MDDNWPEIAGTIADTIEAAQACAEGLSIRRACAHLGVAGPQGIAPRLRAANTRLTWIEGVSLTKALVKSKKGKTTRWRAGPHAERAKRALRRTKARREGTTGHTAGKAASSDGLRMRFGRLKAWSRWWRYDAGIDELREGIEALDRAPGATIGTDSDWDGSGGEIFLVERTPRGRADTGYEFAGPYAGAQQAQGWDDGPDAASDEPIVAHVEEVWWTYREVEGTGTDAEIEAVMTWPGPFSEWTTHPFMPRRHHVRAIRSLTDSTPRRVPHDLRLRGDVDVLIEIERDGVHTKRWVTVEATRGQEQEAALHARKAAEADIEGWAWTVPRAMRHSDTHRPVKGWPYAPKVCEGPVETTVFRNWEGEWEFSEGGDATLDALEEEAEAYEDRGEDELAWAIRMELRDRLPWSLGAMEDVEFGYRRMGRHQDAEAIEDAIVARGLAALEREDFDWTTDTMSWSRHENRPFLRAWMRRAIRLESAGRDTQAETIFARLAAMVPSDGLGARYEALRLESAREDWGAVRERLAKLDEDAGGDAEIARLLVAAATDPDVKKAPESVRDVVESNPITIAVILDDENPREPMRYGGYSAGGFDEANYLWARHHRTCRKTLTVAWREWLRTRLEQVMETPRRNSLFDRDGDENAERARMRAYRTAIVHAPVSDRTRRAAERLVYACGRTREPLHIETRDGALAIEHDNGRDEYLRVELDAWSTEAVLKLRSAEAAWPEGKSATLDDARLTIGRREHLVTAQP